MSKKSIGIRIILDFKFQIQFYYKNVISTITLSFNAIESNGAA